MSTYNFNIVDANNQVGTGSMEIDDSRYKNLSVAQMQQAFDSGTLVLDDVHAPAVPLQGIVYEVTPRPLQGDVSQLPVGKYTIADFMDSVEAAKHYPCIKRAWVEYLGEQPEPAVDRVE